MKLIIEHGKDGAVFFYEESDAHHRRVEKERAGKLRRVDFEELESDCRVDAGTYMVVPLVYENA